MESRNIIGSPKKQWTSPYTQQGDVLLKKVGKFDVFEVEHAKIPKTAKKVPGNLVLKGNTNSHAFYGGKFQLLRDKETLFIKVTEPTVLYHVKDLTSNVAAEHHAQWIPKGEYFYDGILEYDHLKNESRVVVD